MRLFDLLISLGLSLSHILSLTRSRRLSQSETFLDHLPPLSFNRLTAHDRSCAAVRRLSSVTPLHLSRDNFGQFQGHIWRTGYECKDLLGIVFEDVPGALKKWHSEGKKMVCQKTDLQVRIITLYKKVEEKIRLGIFNGDPTGTHSVYIYSSGSREAQRLIFGNTSYGDLRRYLCGFSMQYLSVPIFEQVISNALVWAFQYLSLIDIDDSTVHMVMKLRKMNLD